MKDQDSLKELLLDNGDKEGEVEDSEHSAVVRMTPVPIITTTKTTARSDCRDRIRPVTKDFQKISLYE